ncbi:MAG TPA: Yip1 family protein [Asticcacaulis sp.]|nr:Yip1 family protein [Asticcacaulis sp.]
MNDIVPPAGTPASSGLIDRVKSILLKPSPTWDVIAAEPSSIQSILMGYVVPRAAHGPICMAIGMSVFGISAVFVTVKTPIIWAVSQAIVLYVMTLIAVYVQALVIDGLAPSFGGEKSQLNAYKVAAYSATAAWLAAVFQILPMLSALGIVGLYSLYLMYLGLPKLMKVPQEKAIGYIAVIIIVSFVLYVVAFTVAGMVAGLGRMGTGFGPMASISTPAGSAKLNGTVAVPGVGSVDLGRMQQAANQIEAQASAAQNGQTTVKVADAQALLALMPDNFMGAAKTDPETSSGGAGGMTASTASATYAAGGGTIHLTVSDIGSMGGMAGMVQAMNVNHTETTATGYEKVSTEGGKMVSEKYNNQDKSGEYGVVYGNRISVQADGSNVDMGTLKSLVAQIDAGKAQSLAN